MNFSDVEQYVVPPANADGTQKGRPRRSSRVARRPGDVKVQTAEQAAKMLAAGPAPDLVVMPDQPAQPLHPDPFQATPETGVLEDRPIGHHIPTVPVPQAPQTQMIAPPRPSKADQFLNQKGRMTIEVQDGTFMLPLIAARKSRYGLILFLPMADDSMTFLPKPGTQMMVTVDAGDGRRTYKVYYPGTHAEVPELGTVVLSLVRAEESDGEA